MFVVGACLYSDFLVGSGRGMDKQCQGQVTWNNPIDIFPSEGPDFVC